MYVCTIYGYLLSPKCAQICLYYIYTLVFCLGDWLWGAFEFIGFYDRVVGISSFALREKECAQLRCGWIHRLFDVCADYTCSIYIHSREVKQRVESVWLGACAPNDLNNYSELSTYAKSSCYPRTRNMMSGDGGTFQAWWGMWIYIYLGFSAFVWVYGRWEMATLES